MSMAMMKECKLCTIFHTHGVEIEGIIKCPNEGYNYVAPQKCILVSHMDTYGEAKQNKNTNAQNVERATDQRNI